MTEAKSIDEESTIIRFQVSGEPFDIPMDMLKRHKQSTLCASALFAVTSGGKIEDGKPVVELSRDVRSFRVVRHFMETGEALVPHDSIDRRILLAEATYYGIDGLIAALLPERVNYISPETKKEDAAVCESVCELKSPLAEMTELISASPAIIDKFKLPEGWVMPDVTTIAPSLSTIGMIAEESDKGDEKKGVSAADVKKKPPLTFHILGTASALSGDDKLLYAKEYAARVAFGKNIDATARLDAHELFDAKTGMLATKMLEAFEKSLQNHPGADYNLLTFPGNGRTLELPYVESFEEFDRQNYGMTMGLLRGALGKMPLVQAGGSVLACLHRWIDCDIPDSLPKIGGSVPETIAWKYFKEITCKDEKKNGNVPAPPGKYTEKELEYLSSICFAGNIRVNSERKIRKVVGGTSPLTEDRHGFFYKYAARKRTPMEVAKEMIDAGFPNKPFQALGSDITHYMTCDATTIRRDRNKLHTELVRAAQRERMLQSMMRTDIDLFLVTRDPNIAFETIVKLYEHVRAQVPEILPIKIMRTNQAVTFLMPPPYKSIQIILRLYHSLEHVLCGFDLDCCAVGFDGLKVVALPRAIRALKTRTNVVDVTRQSRNYEERLIKYARRGFEIAVPGLDIERVITQVRSNLHCDEAFRTMKGAERLMALLVANSDRTLYWWMFWNGKAEGMSDYGSWYKSWSNTQRTINRTDRLIRFGKIPFAYGEDVRKVLTTAVYIGKKFPFRKDDPMMEYESSVTPIVAFQIRAPHSQDRVDVAYTGSFNPVTDDWFAPSSSHETIGATVGAR